MRLSAARIDAIFCDCLFTDAEMASRESPVPAGTVLVEGISHQFGFHPERLASHRAAVAAMLDELPASFHYRDGAGVGDLFLHACMTQDGEQWTGEHRVVEALFVLGLGLGLAVYVLPRLLWSAMPGGLPILLVDTSGELAASLAEAAADTAGEADTAG